MRPFIIVVLLGAMALAVPGQALAGISKPLAGNPGVNSWFDHTSPNYSNDGNMTRYDGSSWSTSGSCNMTATYNGIPSNCYMGHSGVDFQASTNTDVLAADSGVVQAVYWDSFGGGNVLRLWHPQLGYSTIYAHLSSYVVTSGNVSRGQVVAKSGCTGTCSGPHVHFEVRNAQTGGQVIDPYGWAGSGSDPYAHNQGVLWGPAPAPTPTPTPTPLPADLYSAKMHTTGSGTTELHILDRNTTYSSFRIQTGTGEPPTNQDQWAFLVGDYNADGINDLYEIKMYGTGTGSTEVHILNGATNYSTYLLHAGTSIPLTNKNEYTFLLGDHNHDGVNDLYWLRMNGSTCNCTEVHVISGTNFWTPLLDTTTYLGSTSIDVWEFDMGGDWNSDGKADLFAFRLNGSGYIEAHVLDGNNNYITFIYNGVTALNQNVCTCQYRVQVGNYNSDGLPDLFLIKMNLTGSNSTEVHVLDRVGNYQTWLLHTATPLPEVNINQFQFDIR